MINKKGLTDKRIQELIDKDLEFTKWYQETWLPMYIHTEAMKIMFEALKETSTKATTSLLKSNRTKVL